MITNKPCRRDLLDKLDTFQLVLLCDEYLLSDTIEDLLVDYDDKTLNDVVEKYISIIQKIHLTGEIFIIKYLLYLLINHVPKHEVLSLLKQVSKNNLINALIHNDNITKELCAAANNYCRQNVQQQAYLKKLDTFKNRE
jgi:hypothetical protein